MRRLFDFKSWRKTLVILLVLIFLCSTISLFMTIKSYQGQIYQTYIRENDYMCEKWLSDTDNRLTKVNEQIYNVFLTLYDDKEFQKELNEIDAFTAKRIVELLQTKTIAYDDISAIFIYDENSNYYAYNPNQKSNIVKMPMVKTYLKEICSKDYTQGNNTKWFIKYIGGNTYFYKCIKMGRFYVGAISDCNLYEFNEEILNSDITIFFSDDNEIILSKGNETLIDYVNEENKTEYRNKYVVTSLTGIDSGIKGTLIVKHNGNEVTLFGNVSLVINSLIEIILIIILFVYIRNRILKQTSELILATKEVSKGNLDYRIKNDDVGSDEFSELYTNFNNMTSQITDLKIKQYDMKLKEEENKLRMLRGQLRPHTFMNGITTISNLTYDNDQENVRKYIYQFSQFTKYMLNTSSEWISIKEEVNQIENYVEMQKLKFANSIECTYDVDPDIEEFKIPYLLLFSQVENSFKHAMSLINTLHINITCEKYEKDGFKGIRLIEEDDGDGFSLEAIKKLDENDNMFTKEHIGLTNTKYTLYILYKRNDLLHISNKETGGAKVEILIPLKGDTDEVTNM